MLTREAVGFVAIFIGIFVLALVLGNFILLCVSLVPLFTILLALLLGQPRLVEIAVHQTKRTIWRGDTIEVVCDVKIRRGIGKVILFQQLPTEFELVAGNNLKIIWKGWGAKTGFLTYKIRCPKRGKYVLRQIQCESRHFLGLIQTTSGAVQGTSIELVVKPKILNMRRIRSMRGIATTPFPVIDIAKMGVTTTDFRQIRDYVYGDPVKTINWKATAKQARKGTIWPLVNEYEFEGRKSVWIFLDASFYMEIGSNIENAFEYSVEATCGVAYYYLDRGYRLGMYIYHDGNRLFYPDSGKKQFNRLFRELIELKASKHGEDLTQAIDRCKSYILGYSPLCVIVTRLEKQSSNSLISGVKKIVLLRGRLRRKLPLMVISVTGYKIIPGMSEYEENAANLLQLETRPMVRTLRALGSSVLEWDPRRESFATALLRQVKVR